MFNGVVLNVLINYVVKLSFCYIHILRAAKVDGWIWDNSVT